MLNDSNVQMLHISWDRDVTSLSVWFDIGYLLLLPNNFLLG